MYSKITALRRRFWAQFAWISSNFCKNWTMRALLPFSKTFSGLSSVMRISPSNLRRFWQVQLMMITCICASARFRMTFRASPMSSAMGVGAGTSKKRFRPRRHCPGNGAPLLLATGELMGIDGFPLPQAGFFQQCPVFLLDLRPGRQAARMSASVTFRRID